MVSDSAAMFGVVVDRTPTQFDLIGYFKARAWRDAVFLKCPRDGDDLERRARFVVEADRSVLKRFFGLAAGIVAVYKRPVGHRENRPRARVHHDRGGVLGMKDATYRAEDVFGALLNIGVERERNRGTRLLAACFGNRDGLTDRVTHDAARACMPSEHRVARVLETHEACPFVFGAHDPEYLRGERPPWVDASHHRCCLYPWDLQSQHLLGLVIGKRVREVHEAGVPTELGERLRLGDAQAAAPDAVRRSVDL